MGCYNALLASLAGYDTVLYDASEDSLSSVPEVQQGIAQMLLSAGSCRPEDVEKAIARTRVSGDLADAVSHADLVSESVFEDVELKRTIHGQLDAVCPPTTILTSNSSTLLISDIEYVIERGDRIAALHSHLGSPLVDIVPGPRTSSATLELLTRYVRSIQGEPLVLKKENPGYVLNAMLGPVIGTSLALCVRGEYSQADIDRAWMASQEAPMGPFGMIDLFGLALVRDSWEHRAREDALQAYRAPILGLLQSKLDEGKQGMKSGSGFYSYPEPQFQQVDFSESGRTSPIVGLLQSALIAHAAILAADEISDIVDVDRAWRIGTGLACGPFEIMRRQGMASTEQGIRHLSDSALLGQAEAAKVLGFLRSHETELCGGGKK